MRRTILSPLFLAGLACSLTLLFLGMRAVMDVGGACADGGPYVSAQPCPEGVPLMMVAGIFGGLICAFAFAATAGPYAGLVFLAWPALFLSLGWNFFEYGIDPPGPDDGPVGGWLFCGVLFALMGGGPLLPLLRPKVIRAGLWPSGEREDRPGMFTGGVITPAAMPQPLARARPAAPPAPPRPSAPTDVVSALERLAKLRADGALDADEFERAKASLLGGPRT